MVTKEEERSRWLKAYKTTLYEYERDIHIQNMWSCEKCNNARYLQREKLGAAYSVKRICDGCPEMVHDSGKLNSPGPGCTSRYSHAFDSRSNIDLEKKRKVIEYHKKAIEYLEKTTKENYSFYSFRLMLYKIDMIFK